MILRYFTFYILSQLSHFFFLSVWNVILQPIRFFIHDRKYIGDNQDDEITSYKYRKFNIRFDLNYLSMLRSCFEIMIKILASCERK